jgi:hypothetical protein
MFSKTQVPTHVYSTCADLANYSKIIVQELQVVLRLQSHVKFQHEVARRNARFVNPQWVDAVPRIDGWLVYKD